jgi:HEPN domain-containing protein
MPHDPELVAETRAWLLKAAQDLGAGSHDLFASPPFTADAAFHAQQAAEKAMKAFLTWHSAPFRKTHALEELGQQCLALEPALAHAIDDAVPLTKYAWKFRYPGDSEDPPPEEAQQALAIARRLLDEIAGRLPPEVRP